MSHAPFPHILIQRKTNIDVVAPKPPQIGDVIQTGVNVNTGNWVYCRIICINNIRPAKGNWLGWNCHPYWMNLEVQRFEQKPQNI